MFACTIMFVRSQPKPKTNVYSELIQWADTIDSNTNTGGTA